MTNYRLIDKTQNQSAATARVTLISMSNGLQSIKVQNHANPMFFDSITNRKTTVEKAHITRKNFSPGGTLEVSPFRRLKGLYIYTQLAPFWLCHGRCEVRLLLISKRSFRIFTSFNSKWQKASKWTPSNCRKYACIAQAALYHMHSSNSHSR